MKTALDQQGAPIEANSEASSTARCPFCGEPVILRRRKGVGGQTPTYFWRHPRLADPWCPGRTSPFRVQSPRQAPRFPNS